MLLGLIGARTHGGFFEAPLLFLVGFSSATGTAIFIFVI
jgi:hypothetical protein